MKVRFKITRTLLGEIRSDLHRRHPFAAERVGFIAAGAAAYDGGVLVLARDYRPVDDDDYVDDPSVGAMMGPTAIMKALEWAMKTKSAMFHVHTHGGRGRPMFSSVDLRENRKFVPDFFKVAPRLVHGALVLSNDSAHGQFWLGRRGEPAYLGGFAEVGSPFMKWESADVAA